GRWRRRDRDRDVLRDQRGVPAIHRGQVVRPDNVSNEGRGRREQRRDLERASLGRVPRGRGRGGGGRDRVVGACAAEGGDEGGGERREGGAGGGTGERGARSRRGVLNRGALD